MFMLTEAGDGVDFDVSRSSERIELLLGKLTGGSDEQVRGFLSRFLRDAGFPSKRAAHIMRAGRSTYFEDLARPFPGINDVPERNRTRQVRIDQPEGRA